MMSMRRACQIVYLTKELPLLG